MLTIVVFDQFFWVLTIYLVLRTLQSQNDRGWLWVGAAIGLGLLTKHSMVFLCFGLTVAILLTPHRKRLLSPYFWAGVGIAFFLFLPNLIWQMNHDWATLEFLRGLNENRMQRISRIEFLIGQFLYMGPFNAPVWIAGLIFFCLSSAGKPYRIFGWTYFAILILFLIVQSKIYYLGPAYPMLFAAGGVAFERLFNRLNLRWAFHALTLFVVLGGLVLLPFSAPVLSFENFKRYADRILFLLPHSNEADDTLNDMFGWPEMVEAVADVYRSLPPEEQSHCAIVTSNYGEAGAIDLFGPDYNLPKAYSGHNSYWYWGPPETGVDTLITVGVDVDELREVVEDVDVRTVFSPEQPNVGERNVPICVCRNLPLSIQEYWPYAKHYD
ncbi:MAG: glycosyltransferase family 39 protein [Candidatus Omnitrophica bacterium]|nr:glycosyltransferase family 39 protein [Candidatus Omnitrophota bacterium]